MRYYTAIMHDVRRIGIVVTVFARDWNHAAELAQEHEPDFNITSITDMGESDEPIGAH